MVRIGQRILPTILVGLVTLMAPMVSLASSSRMLPEPPGLEPRVTFWVDIYTAYTTRQAVLHDAEFPEAVYGVIDLGGSPDGGITEYPETDEEIMELARERIRQILLSLDSFGGDPASLGEEERLVLTAAAAFPPATTLADAAERVRAQRGLADRFRLGLIRSGRYISGLRDLARQQGVPEDLAYLPHVESSFVVGARSRAGAAGMWQFIRSTGRLYLTIDSARDDRLDPWISGRAAFTHLRECHEALGSWPLAITSYNHGLGGMRRAQDRHGSDLVAIIDNYTSRTFGFASKNFYAEFLAARRIAQDPEHWFGPVELDPAIVFEPFTLPDYALARPLARYFSLQPETLEELNPALAPGIWEGKMLIPRGYEMRLPAGASGRLAREWEQVPGAVRFDRKVSEQWHTVRSGENLTRIARRYGTSVRALARLNQLSRTRLIHPGQRLAVRKQVEWVPLDPQLTTSASLPAGVADFLRHVVRQGETLSAIGLRYGTTVSLLARANGIDDVSLIRAGQVILIPLR